MLTLLLVLLFFALLAALQALIVIQVGQCTRALSAHDRRLELGRRARLAIIEALQASVERHDAAGFEPRLQSALRTLKCTAPAVELTREEGAAEVGAWLPMVNNRGTFLSPLTPAQWSAYPELEIREDQPVDLGASLRFKVRLRGLGAAQEDALVVDVRRVGIPLCARNLCIYPHVDKMGGGGGIMAGVSTTESAGEGQVRRSGVRSYCTEGGMPYAYRGEFVQAGFYSELFSTSALGRLRSAAGGRGFALLRAGVPEAVGSGAGIRLESGFVRVDLSQPALSPVLFISAQDTLLPLHLGDGGMGGDLGPLVVVVVGPVSGGLSCVLGECARPVLLLLANAELSGTRGARWVGGVVLDANSGVSGGLRDLHVSHFSCPATRAPADGAVVADLGTPGALLPLYPRINYVVGREVWR